MKQIIWIAVVAAFLFSSPAIAQEPQNGNGRLTADEIVVKSLSAFYYQGRDMKQNALMELIDKDGGKRIRVMTMLRLNAETGGNQKYFIYFHKPRDVKRMTFMVWKYPKKEDDRWIFIPAVDLIRRIAADDKRSSFVGSDFTYEDVSGRDADSDTHTLLREEKLGDKNVYVIQSIPKAATDYTKRLSWIDKKTFLPLREEYYDAQEQLSRLFTADKIEEIGIGDEKDRQIFPTITKRMMKNVKTGHRTEVTYTSVSYNQGLKDKDFSERRMRRPPRSWVR